jgi:hypothetical protein
MPERIGQVNTRVNDAAGYSHFPVLFTCAVLRE